MTKAVFNRDLGRMAQLAPPLNMIRVKDNWGSDALVLCKDIMPMKYIEHIEHIEFGRDIAVQL